MTTIYTEMTTEHLGQEATDDDLASFKDAVIRVMHSSDFDRDPEGATDYVWNNGEIRFEADACIYCSRVVRDRTEVPKADEDLDWAIVGIEHDTDCEWTTTRAHQLAD